MSWHAMYKPEVPYFRYDVTSGREITFSNLNVTYFRYGITSGQKVRFFFLIFHLPVLEIIRIFRYKSLILVLIAFSSFCIYLLHVYVFTFFIAFFRKNIEVTFQEINLTVKMPIDVDCYCMAIRGLWVQYDHYSDQGISFRMPELPDEYQTNMGDEIFVNHSDLLRHEVLHCSCVAVQICCLIARRNTKRS